MAEDIKEITDEEWDKLPKRTKLLINAGFVDGSEIIEQYRRHWEIEDADQV